MRKFEQLIGRCLGYQKVVGNLCQSACSKCSVCGPARGRTVKDWAAWSSELLKGKEQRAA